MVLGDKAEDAFRQSMIMSRGSLSIFWSNGLVATLMLIGLALALGPLLSAMLGRVGKPKASSVVA
jgi:TctA family transporter